MAKKTSGGGGIKKARKPTEAEIKLARQHGFRGAKPKKTNIKPTTASVNAYIERYNVWADKIRHHAKMQRERVADKARGIAGKAAIAGL